MKGGEKICAIVVALVVVVVAENAFDVLLTVKNSTQCAWACECEIGDTDDV